MPGCFFRQISSFFFFEALLDPVMHEVPHTDSRSTTQRDMKATRWASESHSLIRLADAGGQHDSWNDGSNLRPTVFFCLVCFSCVRVPYARPFSSECRSTSALGLAVFAT